MASKEGVRRHGIRAVSPTAEAFEQRVAASVPLSKQIVVLAGEGLDFASAEGRSRFLANAQPLWSALPDGMLKRQLLGEIASRGALTVEELAALWHVGVTPRTRARSAPRTPSTRQRRPPKTHPDRVVWTLLLESSWWQTLNAVDHAMLCALTGWHGEAFRFIDKQTTELGALSWAVLRERISGESWSDSALALVDGEDPGIEPSPEDLRASLEQIRIAPEKARADRVLGRI